MGEFASSSHTVFDKGVREVDRPRLPCQHCNVNTTRCKTRKSAAQLRYAPYGLADSERG